MYYQGPLKIFRNMLEYMGNYIKYFLAQKRSDTVIHLLKGGKKHIFRINWGNNVTSLKNAAKIKRLTKLNSLCIYGVPIYPSASEIAKFIFKHLEPNGKFHLFGPKPPLEFEKEILQLLNLKSGTNDYDKFTVLVEQPNYY